MLKTKTIAQFACSQPLQKCLKNEYFNILMIIYKVNSQSILQVTGYDWKMKSYFEEKAQIGCSFFGFLKSAWYLIFLKLSVHVFDSNSLNFVQTYLTNRFQRCKIENGFSCRPKITTVVPQDSILGPLNFGGFFTS